MSRLWVWTIIFLDAIIIKWEKQWKKPASWLKNIMNIDINATPRRRPARVPLPCAIQERAWCGQPVTGEVRGRWREGAPVAVRGTVGRRRSFRATAMVSPSLARGDGDLDG